MDKIKSAMLKTYGMVRVTQTTAWKVQGPMPFTGGKMWDDRNFDDEGAKNAHITAARAMLALEILGEPASNAIEDHCLNAPGDAEQRVRAWFEAKLDPIEQLAGPNRWRNE